MDTWVTRFAELGDVEALQQLITVSARGLNSEHYSPEHVESILKYIYGVDTQLIHDQTYFVVQDGTIIVGCGGWSRRKTMYGGDKYKGGGPDNLLNPATDAAHIRAFFVHPNWARKGVGSALMTACEDAAHKAGFQRMDLVATLTGEFLYARFGFIPAEEENIPLPDGNVIKARRMTKDVSPSN